MESNVGDILHCEDQLRTTLHCDNKEKLRRKLVLLQREYLRTAQRLQRAERSEAVQRHVRSRITQNHQDQRNPEITSNPYLSPSSLTLNTTNGTASVPRVPQCQEHTGGPANSENSRRSQVIRFLLPSDVAHPQTSDSSHDAARSHRPSPARCLRSRRSRLRWERRSAETGRGTDSYDEGREQSERVETATTEGSEERVKTEGTETLNESEKQFSGTESESSSLLLTHWNPCGQTETGDTEAKEIQGGKKKREKETELRAEGKKESTSTSLLLTCWNPAIHTEGRGQDGTPNGRRKKIEGGEEGENSIGQRDGRLYEDNSSEVTQQNAAQKIESGKSHDNTVEIKEEKCDMVGVEHDVKEVGLLDSCTLVEGLLFPAEYYVRTTRRMASSQSQPNMQAVILAQLSMGRHRRSRGRRGSNRHTHNHECSAQHTETDISSLATASPSVGPCLESQAADTSAELNSQTSSEMSDQISACQIDTGACFSPMVSTAHPARGKRRRRGRGRGRPQSPRCSLSVDTHQLGPGQISDDPQPTSSPVYSSPSLHGADGPKPYLTPREAVPVPDDPRPAPTHGTATQPSSGGNGAQSSSASVYPHVYPIFLKSSGRTKGSSQMSRSTANWKSLLLPSSPPAQTPLFPLPSLCPRPLVNNLMNFDISQDFHLPDDQFASLKLYKLRQVTVESQVEHFTSPSYNTRRSNRHSDTRYSSTSIDPVTPLPLLLSLTPTIPPNSTDAKQAATQPADLQNLSTEHKLTGKFTSQFLSQESSDRENPGEQQTESLRPECQTRTTSIESVSVAQDWSADYVNQHKEKDTVIQTRSQSSVSASNTRRSVDQFVKPQPDINFADRSGGKMNEYVISRSDEPEIKESSVTSSEEQIDCPDVVDPLEDQRSTSHQTEDKANTYTLSFDCSPQKTAVEPFNNCTAVQACNNSESPGESLMQHLNVKSPANDSNKSSEPTRSLPRENENQDKSSLHHRVHSLLLLSPTLASTPFITPQLHSTALTSSPTLPSLGLTPHPVPAALLLTTSPSAPTLTLPSLHSPSVQALSPPALSPCPSVTSLPPSQPSASPNGQISASSKPSQRVEPATQVCRRTEETAEDHMTRYTHTLKAPAGGCLVDACCLPGSSGGLWVAAAGKWAVCLWSQSSASDWSLIHTWAFNEPVINVFPVPDAAGLMCVTLGQLEIREVRILSCSSLQQVPLYEELVQAVVGVSNSRVVTSSHSASDSTLQVFMLSDGGSTLSSQPLVSPGVCVGALAPVEGLPDALIGTDEGGHLFVWNLRTGQLLRKITLGDGLSHTACLRGYSYCGVLFVLLQHQLLTSLEEEEREATAKDQMFLEGEEEEEERKKTALFSLVAINPLSGKSVLATRLYPPKAWSGRLCEADVNSSSVVGLSQSGCVCVWELGCQGVSRMVWATENEGWQLARWGGGGTLVTGHHSGDVTLHCYSTSQTNTNKKGRFVIV